MLVLLLTPKKLLNQEMLVSLSTPKKLHQNFPQLKETGKIVLRQNLVSRHRAVQIVRLEDGVVIVNFIMTQGQKMSLVLPSTPKKRRQKNPVSKSTPLAALVALRAITDVIVKITMNRGQIKKQNNKQLLNYTMSSF